MVITEELSSLSSYKEDNIKSAHFVKETLPADNWWMKVDIYTWFYHS